MYKTELIKLTDAQPELQALPAPFIYMYKILEYELQMTDRSLATLLCRARGD